MNTTTTPETETWVYVGQTMSGSKTYHHWLTITDGKPDTDTDHLFAKNLAASVGVGSIYEVTITRKPDGGLSVTTGGAAAPKFVGMHDDDVTVQRWHAAHRGTLGKKATEAERKRAVEGAPTMFDMTLVELRDVITGTNWSRREGIIGAAIAYLMSGER